MWYVHLSEFLHQKGYTSNKDYTCMAIPRWIFYNLGVRDHLNIVGTPRDTEEASCHLMSKLKMNNLGNTKISLGMQLEHSHDGILVHQAVYIQKVLYRFEFDKACSSKTPEREFPSLSGLVKT
jgi:hypothetical protein